MAAKERLDASSLTLLAMTEKDAARSIAAMRRDNSALLNQPRGGNI
jgi:hypothetical protein